jgi:broad specificity phosphatase PhoE
VREYHRQYWEEDRYARDVLIVAHGHFIRSLIPRWMNAPLTYGRHIPVLTFLGILIENFTGAYFDAEPGGVRLMFFPQFYVTMTFNSSQFSLTLTIRFNSQSCMHLTCKYWRYSESVKCKL